MSSFEPLKHPSITLVLLLTACGRIGYELVVDVEQSGADGNGGLGAGAGTSSSGGANGGTSSASGGSENGAGSGVGASSNAGNGSAGDTSSGGVVNGGAGDTGSGGVVNGGAGDTGSGGCGSGEICDGQDNDCSGTADDGAVCGSNCFGYTYGGHAYVFCNDGVVLADAIAGCTAHDMLLAKIEDQPENEWLRSVVYSYSGDSFAAYEWRWIGANDLDDDGVWTWADGSAIVYSNWGGNNPQDNDDGVTQQNGQINPLWNSMPADLTRPYICELY